MWMKWRQYFSRTVIFQPWLEQILGDMHQAKKTTSEAGDVIDDRSDEILD